MMWHRRETRRPTENTKLNLRTRTNLPTHPILGLLVGLIRPKLQSIVFHIFGKILLYQSLMTSALTGGQGETSMRFPCPGAHVWKLKALCIT